MLTYIIWLVVLGVAFTIGVFGFAQIIGSLQNIRSRGIGMTLFTIILWALILGGTLMFGLNKLPQYKLAMYIGYGVSFVKILLAGKIY